MRLPASGKQGYRSSIVCVRNCDDAMSFIGQPAAESALAGRALLQLTTGT